MALLEKKEKGMAWIVIFLAIYVIFFSRKIYKMFLLSGTTRLDDRIMGSIMSLMVAVMFGAIGLVVSIVTYQCMPHQWVEVGKTNLVSLRDQNGVSGRFFLGSGSFESSPYYFYYTGSQERGYTPHKLRADEKVTIYEQDRVDAELVYTKSVVDPKIGILAWFATDPQPSFHYNFYIPQGSLRQGFSIG